MLDSNDPYERIFWSADVPDATTLLARLDEMPELKWVKIDQLFFLKNGWDIFAELRARGLKIFCDAKSIEIPTKLRQIAKTIIDKTGGVDMLNCMAGGLSNRDFTNPDVEMRDGLRQFADVCLAPGVAPCSVTVLTTKDPKTVGKEFDGRTPVEQVLFYLPYLRAGGFTDVVCSPQEIQAIRRDTGFASLNLNTPGVRPEWSVKGDQARVTTPLVAILAGADRLVIGRPITDQSKFGGPANNLRAIAEEVGVALT